MSDHSFNQHKRVTITGEVIIDDTIPIDVNVTNDITIDDSTPIEVSDTTGTKDINILEIDGSGISHNTGNSNAGCQRIVIADDDINLSAINNSTIDIPNIIGQDGVAIPSRVILLGASDGGVTEVLQSNGSGALFVDIGGAGTTNVNLAEVLGVAVTVASGNVTTNTQRVTIATDDPNLSAIVTALALPDDTWDNIALGLVAKKTPWQIYLSAIDIDNNTERIIMDDTNGEANLTTCPVAPIASTISSTDTLQVSQVILKYYTSATDTDVTTEIITMTGLVGVALLNNFYRAHSITIMPGTLVDNAGKIYVGSGVVDGAGRPAVVYDFMPSYLNSHYSPWIWVPFGKKLVFDNIVMNNGSNGAPDIMRITVYSHPTPDVTQIAYRRDNFLHQNGFLPQRFYSPVPAGATFHMTAQKIGGNGTDEITIIFNAYLYDTT